MQSRKVGWQQPSRGAVGFAFVCIKGGTDQIADESWVQVAGFSTPVPETENHLLMIQSDRFLTNNLYQRWAGLVEACPGSVLTLAGW